MNKITFEIEELKEIEGVVKRETEEDVFREGLGVTSEDLEKCGEVIKRKGKIKTSLAGSFRNGIKRSHGERGTVKSKEELIGLAYVYFSKIDLTGEKPTLSGLCNDLGISTQSFRNYEERIEYAEVMNRMRNTLNSALVKGTDIKDIFELKNNYGYKDKSEQSISIENPMDKYKEEELDEMIIKLEKQEDGSYGDNQS